MSAQQMAGGRVLSQPGLSRTPGQPSSPFRAGQIPHILPRAEFSGGKMACLSTPRAQL